MLKTTKPLKNYMTLKAMSGEEVEVAIDSIERVHIQNKLPVVYTKSGAVLTSDHTLRVLCSEFAQNAAMRDLMDNIKVISPDDRPRSLESYIGGIRPMAPRTR